MAAFEVIEALVSDLTALSNTFDAETLNVRDQADGQVTGDFDLFTVRLVARVILALEVLGLGQTRKQGCPEEE